MIDPFKALWRIVVALALTSLSFSGQATAAPAPALSAQVRAALRCTPGGPCAARIPVRVVVVTMFEIGADTGDTPGEFQMWRERRGLSVRVPFPQSHHDLYYNPQTQVLSMVTGMGSIRSATATLALGLDARFDLSRAYWLVAGIAGVDPHQATIGSAVWAHYLVDGDLAHEIDAREIPQGWRSGYFALNSTGPADRHPQPGDQGEVYALNPALADWAYGLTKSIALPDSPDLAAARAGYAGMPAALAPPRVMTGDNLAAMTFWHGAMMTQWAHDWVDFWTQGKGTFVTSAMEETGTAQSLAYLSRIGRADRNRLLVLRGASNFTMPPPGVAAADYLNRENQNFSGMTASLEALYTVGGTVVDALLKDWPRFEKAPPGAPSNRTGQ